MGIMDEERRTTVNLAECIRAAQRSRGLHQYRLSRPHRRRNPYLDGGRADGAQERHEGRAPGSRAYEDKNVDVGLAAGLRGRAQIGKGMWAMPDLMAEMLRQKIGHPMAGANTAWVPSPTAATLHATHYHEVDVPRGRPNSRRARRRNWTIMLTIPLADRPNWSPEEIAAGTRQ